MDLLIFDEIHKMSEYISGLEEDEEIMSFDNGSTYFWTQDIENLIEEKLKQKVS